MVTRTTKTPAAKTTCTRTGGGSRGTGRRFASGALAAVVLLSACRSTPPPESAAPCGLGRACTPVTETGGTLTVAPSSTVLDRAALNIPQGALSTSLAVTLDLAAPSLGPEATAAAGASAPLIPLGLTLRLGPEGTAFGKPVTVSVPFDPTLLPYETKAADVRVVVKSADGRWEALTPADLSLADGIAHVALSHFSELTVVAPQPRVDANANYRLFHGLDDTGYSSEQQAARLQARCTQLADTATGYPRIRWQNPDISRAVGLIKLAPGTDLSHLLRGQNTPSADEGNQFFALTGKVVAPGDPQKRTYDQVLRDSILASKTQLRPADVLRLALQATSGDYPLAVLTAHNVIKEQTYGGRDSAFGITAGPDPRALFASKLENLRRDPQASDAVSADKMGPWYHTFGVLFVASSLGPASGEALVDTEHLTRLVSQALPDWWANVPLVGGFKSSPLDLGKAAVDNCMLDAAVKIAAAAKAAALGPGSASTPSPAPTPSPSPTRAPAVQATKLACPPRIDLAGTTATLAEDRQPDYKQLGSVICTYNRPGGTYTLEATWIEQGGDAQGYSLGFCGVSPSASYVYSQTRNARVTQGGSGLTPSTVDAAQKAYAAGPWLKSVEQVAEPCRR